MSRQTDIGKPEKQARRVLQLPQAHVEVARGTGGAGQTDEHPHDGLIELASRKATDGTPGVRGTLEGIRADVVAELLAGGRGLARRVGGHHGAAVAAAEALDASGVSPYAPMLTRPPLGIGSRANAECGSPASMQGL